MRILTNEMNLPAPLFHAIRNDTYEARGDISVTSLIDSPYVRLLRMNNTYTEDASDMIWALTGQAIHSVIERAGDKFDGGTFYPEVKLKMAVQGKILSGTPDLIECRDDGVNILHDYKNIFVYAYKLGEESGSYKKWVKQTNIYVQMIKHGVMEREYAEKYGRGNLGFDIHEIYVHAFIRDWNRNKSEYTFGYPEHPVATYRIPLYSSDSILNYVNKQMMHHTEQSELYKRIYQSELPVGEVDTLEVCSEEDRWVRPTTWRMVKKGAKRSLKNFEINSKQDEQDANLWWASKIAEHPTLQIDKVPGEDIRCVNYCPVNMFCKYYKKTYGEEKETGSVGGGDAYELLHSGEKPVVQKLKLNFGGGKTT